MASAQRRVSKATLAVGRPKNPLYIHPTEIANFRKVELAQAKGLVRVKIGQRGKQPIPLKRETPYLWTIDRDGVIALSPKTFYGSGSEKSGHVLMTGGRPARLAGELFYDKGKSSWVLNNDSGRYGFHGGVTKQNLQAARRAIEKIGLYDGRGSVTLSASFIATRPVKPGRDRWSLRFEIMERLGGYYPLTSTGPKRGPKVTPLTKLRWMKRARAAYGTSE